MLTKSLLLNNNVIALVINNLLPSSVHIIKAGSIKFNWFLRKLSEDDILDIIRISVVAVGINEKPIA